MSGHSKWHNIQARKGKQDARKANEFTKAAKQITIAAQRGGDPTMNFSLRLAIDKAKAVGMPKDNIDRAIKRGTGEIEGGHMEETMYEAFGPGGVAVLIKCVTDNKNRTLSEIKHLLSVHGGSFAGPGSVAWMFNHVGHITLDKKSVANKDELELDMIESGADDFKENAEDLDIITKPENFQKALARVRDLKLEPIESSIRYLAKEHVSIPKDQEEKLAELFGELEAHDDVEDYFTNAN